MKEQRTKIDFSGQTLFIGIDVHKKSWAVTIRISSIVIKKFSMVPEPMKLIEYLKSQYPGAMYYSVYEAGFCGYHHDRNLRAGGINNIIVNAGHVPSNNRERLGKSDPIDSSKLARELENGTLNCFKMYIPTHEEEGFRCLCRLALQQTKDQARVKNRIKSLLNFIGIPIPEQYNKRNWSNKFLNYLVTMELSQDMVQNTLRQLCKDLKNIQSQLALTKKYVQEAIVADGSRQRIAELLRSIPGIGAFTTAVLIAELMNIERFSSAEKLCCYVGLVPDSRASGQKHKDMGLSQMYLRYLRNLLVEASWRAIRKDTVLLAGYADYCKRMNKKKAIIKVARRLLNRIACVWRTGQPYQAMLLNNIHLVPHAS